MSGRGPEASRRHWLRTCGIVGAVGIAGCTSEGDDPDDGSSGSSRVDDGDVRDDEPHEADEGATDEADEGAKERAEGDGEDERWTDVERIVLGASGSGWEGVEPELIAGERNPTLVLYAGREYEFVVENADGGSYSLEIHDADGELVGGYRSESVEEVGSEATLEVVATEEMERYTGDFRFGVESGEIDVHGRVDEADEEEDDEPHDRVVKLGILQPETGDLGELGTPIADAAELPALQLENERSPVSVDVMREDTQTNVEVGISRAEDLVAAGYPSFTGAAVSDVTIQVAKNVAIPNRVPMISPASTASEITDLDGDYVLRTAPSDALQGGVMAELAYEDRGWETVATLYLDIGYGQAIAAEFSSAYENLGGDILDEVPFESGQASYTAELERALSDDPDVLVIVAFPFSGIQILRDFYADFDETPVVIPDGLVWDGLPDDVDNPMDNVIGTAPTAGGPEVDAFDELYEGEYGASPDVFNAQAYDASAVQILANLRGGENDGQTVSEQIRAVTSPGGTVVGPSTFPEACELATRGEEIEYRGASSPVVFDENGDMRVVSYDVYEVGETGFEVVDSLEYEA